MACKSPGPTSAQPISSNGPTASKAACTYPSQLHSPSPQVNKAGRGASAPALSAGDVPECSVDLRARGTALPGVRDVLKAVSVREGWISSVLTGNIAANARVKLSAFELDPLLDLSVGAYGEDAVQRPDLVAVARSRVHQLRGVRGVPVVLVGDTPRDVEAALSTGSGIIAVASGIHSEEELTAAEAPVVLPDLSDTAGLLEILAGFARW
ncbi:haloacid dehalogenase-like hydrolase [Streptomyces sp. GMR22]|nr:haloacid dehalogenase-like hydrolase [Streptomyces sp. GMR22]